MGQIPDFPDPNQPHHLFCSPVNLEDIDGAAQRILLDDDDRPAGRK
jgi:hypothetical protein